MRYPLLDDAVTEVEQSLPDELGAADVAEWYAVQQLIDAYIARLKVAAGLIGGMCAETIPREKGATIISEGKTYRRTGTPTRKGWQTPELLRVVKDSRAFDPKTGELLNAEELILKVWALGPPRVTALKELNIDADEFCETTWANVGVTETTAL